MSSYSADSRVVIRKLQSDMPKEQLQSNALIHIFVPAFILFMMFLSPLVLNKNVYYAFEILIGFVVLSQSYRTLSIRTAGLILAMITSFAVYTQLNIVYHINKILVLNMATVAMFIGVFVLNYILIKAYLMKNSLSRNVNLLKFVGILFNIISIYCLFEYLMKFNPVFSQFFNADYHRYYSIKRGYELYRVSGPMQHPIVMGNFLIIGALLNYYLFNQLRKNLYALFMLVNVAALFLTFSRSSYIALGAGILTYLLFATRNKDNKEKSKIPMPRAIAITFSIPVILLIMMSVNTGDGSLWSTIVDRFSNAEGTASVEQRSGGIQYVLDLMFHSKPLNLLIGHGYGMISWNMRQEGTSIVLNNFYIIDNQYFTFFYEFGIVGMFILFAGIVHIIKRSFKHLNTGNVNILKFTAASFVAIMVNIIFYEGAYWTSIAFLLSFILALNTYAISKEAAA
ncbi:hypothetical protein PaecuDRAFT_4758 [Paenibacillus curdlanolyticus YK9]|uniref:O-antigen ligase-related domain-containing protein n=2 Tax=Paenibacillus curdlanolyticus TaxID=59840 RepID=E0IGG5_9BACL|nr:hypothetical protein PaecuDRAFT_4758 [Paenibacillus curdlanolyticus YK9]